MGQEQVIMRMGELAAQSQRAGGINPELLKAVTEEFGAPPQILTAYTGVSDDLEQSCIALTDTLNRLILDGAVCVNVRWVPVPTNIVGGSSQYGSFHVGGIRPQPEAQGE